MKKRNTCADRVLFHAGIKEIIVILNFKCDLANIKGIIVISKNKSLKFQMPQKKADFKLS